MINRYIIILIAFIITGIISCKYDEAPEGTFQLIQTKIFDKSCALSGCHLTNSDATFVQHQLVLSVGNSWNNLVNVSPSNADAKSDQLLRVKPGDEEKSFLLHKLHGSHHHDGNYGSPMPLGLPLLSEGQVEFVRQWIMAGAPATGSVADVTLLDDTTPQAEEYEPLAPPPAGEGIQINLSPFKVAPSFEREFFVYKKLNNATPIYVNRFEVKMRQNSHHFILYDFNSDIPDYLKPSPDFVRDIRSPDGSLNIGYMLPMAYHVFVAGTQTPYQDYKFPDGIALEFPANMSLDMNSHYVNKSASPIDGEVNVNLYTIPKDNVQKIAKTLNLANNNLSIPAGQQVTLTKSFAFSKTTVIHMLTSHTHQLGKKFVIKINGGTRNGEVVYTSTDWHHPVVANFNPPIVLQTGEGLTSEITYQNATTANVKFGLTSNDEMGIIFGYYTDR